MPRVILFGVLQQVAGWRERLVDVDSLDGLRSLLSIEDPELSARIEQPDVFAVINKALVRGDHPLEPEDEVAFAPPVSGG